MLASFLNLADRPFSSEIIFLVGFVEPTGFEAPSEIGFATFFLEIPLPYPNDSAKVE